MIFKILDRAFGLGVMARPGGELAIPKRAQVAADRLRADRAAEFFPDPLGQTHWARSASRQRTTPCTAGSGPLSTIAVRTCRWGAFNRRDGPGALRSIRPSGPPALNFTIQSRTICKPTPPIRAASPREPPS
jgi:hypothetical protein